jgi:hypothetical protein
MSQPPFDIRRHLEALVGTSIPTIARKQENRILEIRGGDVIVATSRSPQGKPVPIQEIEAAWLNLKRRGELSIEVKTVGYRSAFVGAVLATVPEVEVVPGTRRLRVARLGHSRSQQPPHLPPRSRELVDATPLQPTQSGMKACVEMTIYADGHAGIAVSRIEGSPPRRRIVQADNLPLNDVDELRGHVLAVIERLRQAATKRSE